MASIEFINKRIAGKKAEIEKLEKKLARILKAKESNWQNNPYYYGENDLKWETKHLEEAKAALAKYEADLATETEKDNSRNVKAVIDFLNAWAKRVYGWYEERFAAYPIDLEEYYRKDREHADWHNNGGWKDPNKAEINKEFSEYRKAFHAKWASLYPYVERRTFNGEKLRKELEQEKKAKYDDMIARTNIVCGTITDATGLSVGEKGELNGLVIGERGKARIETIGAGGWNIQCFHFRTLVHEVK